MSNRQFAPTRRRFIAGTAGALGAAALGGSARVMAQDASPVASPAATPAAVEPPDMTGSAYPFQIGTFSCLAVSDGAFAGPSLVQLVLGQTPQEEADRIMAEAGIDPSQLVAQKTSIVIDTGEQRVLVDTGSGAMAGPGVGLLLDNLRREGFQPNDIDVVVLTHAHADHVGGNVTASGNALFSNARYVMAQEEWDFWTDEQAVEEAITNADFRQGHLDSVQRNLLPIEDQFELIGYDEEIVPGVTSVAAQGHTPGHMALRVESDGDQLWIMGDAALSSLQLTYPEAVGVPDTYPDQVVETRRALFEQIAGGGGMATFNHFHPFPSVGQLTADGDVWSWEAVEPAVEEEA